LQDNIACEGGGQAAALDRPLSRGGDAGKNFSGGAGLAVRKEGMELEMADVKTKRARFHALHRDGCFVLPNPWDIGSARLFQHLGFEALASTSSGFAWTVGRADYATTRDETLAHLAGLCAAVDLPVNADYQSAFAAAPEDVAANVALALEAGVAGLSVEDTKVDGPGLYDMPLAVERVRAAAQVTRRHGAVLVARTGILLHDRSQVAAAIDKLVAFAEAGADCLYAPGLAAPGDIAALVKAVAPKPVNVLMTGPGPQLAELAALGVRRVSVGGGLARVAWKAVLDAAQSLRAGSFAGLANAASGRTLNEIFS
jgi:2-methylisocitrate lyase-like PEP mutase family enzyme